MNYSKMETYNINKCDYDPTGVNECTVYKYKVSVYSAVTSVDLIEEEEIYYLNYSLANESVSPGCCPL